MLRQMDRRNKNRKGRGLAKVGIIAGAVFLFSRNTTVILIKLFRPKNTHLSPAAKDNGFRFHMEDK